MKHKFLNRLFLGLFMGLIFGASSLTASAQNISIDGSIGNGKLQKGKTAVATIVLNIPGELHINSSRPSRAGLIATRVKVTGAGLTIGKINYPAGKMVKFQFSDSELSVYEGRTTISFNVTVPDNFKGSVAKIRAVVNYQSCTNEVCYPPRNGDVTLSASGK